MSNRLIVLDRDGVINQDSAHYIKSAEEWLPLPGSIEAICQMSQKGFRIFVATNQAGLARGLFSLNDLNAMHSKMQRLIETAGGSLDGIFYCPHHPDDDCDCRKPMPGMLKQIEQRTGISLSGQPFVGDSIKDVQAAIAAGARPVLVRTGNGIKSEAALESLQLKQVEVFDDLLSFAQSLD